VGIQVNMDKTNYMTVATSQGDVSVPGLGSLQQVDDFKYLGSMMGSSQADIAIRRGQAWEAFWNMKAIWRSTELPLHLKVCIFHSTCLSILLFGSEAWSVLYPDPLIWGGDVIIWGGVKGDMEEAHRRRIFCCPPPRPIFIRCAYPEIRCAYLLTPL